MRIEQVAELQQLQLAYLAFPKAIGPAARKLVRELGATPLAPAMGDIGLQYM